MITNESIQQVLDTADIVDIIGDFVALKKSGSTYKGLSPFTNEKSGSFFVVPAKNIFKCFSSGKGGSVVTFLMQKEGYSFVQAIEYMAKKTKVDLVYEDVSEEEVKRKATEREEAIEVMDFAAKKYAVDFADNYQSWKQSELSLFLEKRGLTDFDAAEWGLGVAPNEWKYITKELVRENKFGIATTLGLVSSKEEKTFDFFRHRIMFPIHDDFGRFIGYAGRLIESEVPKSGDVIFGGQKLVDSPKYINSKESFLYRKEQILYGYHKSRKAIIEAKSAFLVEGYMDVISMHAMGVRNTVAYCSKHVTEAQAKKLSRDCSSVTLVVEDNEACKAVLKSVSNLFAAGLYVRICDLRAPEKKCDGNDLLIICHNEAVMAYSNTIPKGSKKDFSADIAHLQIELFQATIKTKMVDAIEWIYEYLNGGVEEKEIISANNRDIISLIPVLTEESLKVTIFDQIQAVTGLKARDLKAILKSVEAEQKAKSKVQKLRSKDEERDDSKFLSDNEYLPEWVSIPEIKRNFFVQREQSIFRYPIGIYFPPIINDSPIFSGVEQVTNYTIKPLFQVFDQNDGRYIAEVWNGSERNVVEFPNKALVSKEMFMTTLVLNKCFVLPKFKQFHFLYLAGYIMKSTPKCWELRTLGQQPEGFFAFADAIVHVNDKAEVVKYNELGIATVDEKNYLSPGVSSVKAGFREEDDAYENDLYLRYKESPVSFAEWAKIYCDVYDDYGRFGVAFALLSIYKDLIYKIGAKCPFLYLYGPKGSGKSAMGESLMWLFYSGKNAEGRLIQAVNMSPGMITDFALASSLRRFRNCPRLYNEYDPNLTDPKYRGWFKGAFDGEGRERGSISGNTKKTEIMKVQGTLMLAGQYIDSNDDGAIMTRSINLRFSEEKNKSRTEEQKDNWRKLNKYESRGLSGALVELLAIRGHVADNIRERFITIMKDFHKTVSSKGLKVEERLLQNYSLCCAFTEVVNEKITLPFSIDRFKADCISHMIEVSNMISDASVMNKFWSTIEGLIEAGRLEHGKHYKLANVASVSVRVATGSNTIQFTNSKRVLFIRMESIMAEYSKEMRSRGVKSFEKTTIETYLKDQSYFIGMCPKVAFAEKDTSAFALDYELMEERGFNIANNAVKHNAGDAPMVEANGEEMPF